MKLSHFVICLTGFVLAMAPTKAFSQFKVGDDIYEKCYSQQPTQIEAGVCLGYIAGVADAIIALQESGVMRRAVCFPSGGTVGQFSNVFFAYLKSNSSGRASNAYVLLHRALAEAYPC